MQEIKYLLITILIFLSFRGSTQNPTYLLSGTVYDSLTNETIAGALIQVIETKNTLTTDNTGSFKISLRKGNYNVRVIYIGYEEYLYKLNLDNNVKLSVSLKPKTTLKEVVVSGEKEDKNVKNANPGETEINAAEIKNLPVLLGEADILKSIQLLPGVQASDEGGTSLEIRGSSFGENLITYDNAVIYNPSHLMGFLSVFNNDAIDEVKLIKSGMPSDYGGRIASVIEVTSKNGDLDKPSVSGGIGLLSSRISLESPIKKGKGSIIISARRTYLDLISGIVNSHQLSDVSNNNNDLSFFKTTKYYFYDVNLKAIYNLTNNDIITFSSYIGGDNYKYNYNNTDFAKMLWGNKLASLRWTHKLNSDIYFENIIYVTNYTFGFNTTQNDYNLQLNSGNTDMCYKFDINIMKFKHNKIKAGLDYINHNMSPTKISAEAFDLNLKFADMSNLYSNEYAAYVNDEIEITKRLNIIAGLRYSLFQQIGPFTNYIKGANGQISDTVNYKKNHVIQSYSRPEPRLSLCYLLNETSSIKASFTQNEQYIHLVSLPSVSMPSDIWIPSILNVPPELGTQYTLGYFRNFQNNTFETYIDAYYKHIDNLIEFENGVINSVFEQSLYSNITSGSGNMAGVEFYLKKKKGRCTGSISYTLSTSTEQCDALNNGNTFYSSQDRRHNLSVMVNYELNKRWNFSAVFVFISGQPITVPDQFIVINQNLISEYGPMNSYRLPDYYRLDIAANYNLAIGKRYESSLNFSIYNVTDRANPFYVYFETTGNIANYSVNIQAKQISLFPILPSITWNFKF